MYIIHGTTKRTCYKASAQAEYRFWAQRVADWVLGEELLAAILSSSSSEVSWISIVEIPGYDQVNWTTFDKKWQFPGYRSIPWLCARSSLWTPIRRQYESHVMGEQYYWLTWPFRVFWLAHGNMTSGHVTARVPPLYLVRQHHRAWYSARLLRAQLLCNDGVE